VVRAVRTDRPRARPHLTRRIGPPHARALARPRDRARDLPPPARRHRVATRVATPLASTLLAAALCLPGAARAQDGTVTGRVTESGGDGIVGVTVAVTGQPRGAITRSDGSYRLTLPAGSYELTARLIGYASVKANVVVVAGGTVTQSFTLARAASVLNAVAVTGSRRTTERTITQAPVPIDVVGSAEIKQTGRTETSQILQMLVPSVNFPRTSIAGGVDMQRPFTLRGLGPDQALVLINGKRRHAGSVVAVNNSVGRGSTGVDLNAIPASSIERIEVLRDGAAAQYGSDAIAGVINVILKEDAPATFSVTAGQVSSSVNSAPYGTQRFSDGGVVQIDGNKGWSFLGGRAFLNLTGEGRDRGATSRSLPDQRPQYFTAATDDSVRRGLPVTVGGVRIPEAAVDYARNNTWFGDAALRDGGGAWNAGYDTKRGIRLYSFGAATYRVGQSWGFARRPQEAVVVRALYPQGFLPSIIGTSQDYSGALGAKGDAKGWAWDLSGAVGQNRFGFAVRNSNNPSLGLASPRNFENGDLRSTQLTFNGDLSRQFGVGMAAPMNVGLGVEGRFDRYQIFRGEEASYIDGGQTVLDGPNRGGRVPAGSQLFYGFKPSDEVNATRNSQAGYLDVEITPFRRLQLGAAGRFENFSDFGSATIGKLTGRLEGTKWLALRGAASTGFRAPSLAQTYYSSTASNVLIVAGQSTANEVATLPVTSPAARALGATDLTPERSRNVSAGIALTPSRDVHGDGRLLRHRHRRPDRPVGDVRRPARAEPDPPVRPAGGRPPAVLHQRDRHAHPRHRRRRPLCPRPRQRELAACDGRLQQQPHAHHARLGQPRAALAGEPGAARPHGAFAVRGGAALDQLPRQRRLLPPAVQRLAPAGALRSRSATSSSTSSG
jgi:iron complex outermembrane receptor protein